MTDTEFSTTTIRSRIYEQIGIGSKALGDCMHMYAWASMRIDDVLRDDPHFDLKAVQSDIEHAFNVNAHTYVYIAHKFGRSASMTGFTRGVNKALKRYGYEACRYAVVQLGKHDALFDRLLESIDMGSLRTRESFQSAVDELVSALPTIERNRETPSRALREENAGLRREIERLKQELATAEALRRKAEIAERSLRRKLDAAQAEVSALRAGVSATRKQQQNRAPVATAMA